MGAFPGASAVVDPHPLHQLRKQLMTVRLINTPDGFVDHESLAAHQLPTAQDPAREHIASRVHTGAIRVTVGHGLQDMGVSRYVVGRDDAAPSTVAQSFRQMGPQGSVQLIPGDETSRTDVRTAARMGLIRQDEHGRWIDVASVQQAQQAPQQAQEEQQQQDPGAEYFSPEDDATWAQMIDPLPQQAYDSSVARAMGLIAYGTGSLQSVANALARDGGIEPSRARELVEDGIEVHRRAVVNALAKEGMDESRAAEFFASVKSRPDALHAALQRLTMGRDVGGFVELARAFEVANPSAEVKALEAMGFEVSRDPQGKELMARPRGSGRNWVSAKALIAKMKA